MYGKTSPFSAMAAVLGKLNLMKKYLMDIAQVIMFILSFFSLKYKMYMKIIS